MTPYLWFQHNRSGASLWLILLRRSDAAVWNWSTGQWVTYSEANIEAQHFDTDGEIVAGTAGYEWDLSAQSLPGAEEEFDVLVYEGAGVIEDMAVGAVWRWAFGYIAVDVAAWNTRKLTTTDPLPNVAAGGVGGLPVLNASSRVPADVGDKTGFKLASDGLATVTAWTVNFTGNLSGSVGSVVGHTPQTGDVYALAVGSSGFAAIKSDTAAILLDTGTDGVVVAPASKSGFKLASDGLAAVTAWTVNFTGNLSGSVGGIAGTIQTLAGLADALATAHGPGPWGATPPTGARTVTVTVTDGIDPLEGATVRATKGSETKVLLTNASGVAPLPLDDGTWNLVITHPGYDGSTESLVVSADAAITRVLTLQAITPPASSGVSTGVLTVYDTEGVVESGVTVTIRLKSGPGAAGLGYDGADRSEVSNASGLVQFPGLFRGASYTARRGDGRWVEFTVPDAAAFNLPEVIGEA